jgi:PIF1-like helicase
MLIIDEISMVRADLMDGMDTFLRVSRGNDAPFGGVQVVMFGDLYQIPPVVDATELDIYFNEQHWGPYFFQADVFRRFKPKRVMLVKNYRQTDEEFLSLLRKVRHLHRLVPQSAESIDPARQNRDRFHRLEEKGKSPSSRNFAERHGKG